MSDFRRGEWSASAAAMGAARAVDLMAFLQSYRPADLAGDFAFG